jgi:hypothetical protein
MTDLTETELLQQELARRDDVIRNIIGLCGQSKPADALKAFGEEITLRLRDIVADDKLEIKRNLIQPEEAVEEDTDLIEAIEALLDLSEDELEAMFESDEVSDEEKDAVSELILELMKEVGLTEGTFEDLKNALAEKTSDGPHLHGTPEGTLGGKGPTPTKADGPKLGCGGDMKDTLKTKGSHPNPPVGPKTGPSAKHLKAGDLSNVFKK